jgi:hypothetical protein
MIELRGILGVLVGVVVIAAVATGCGGGDDDDSLTKAEFTKQGNAICLQSENEKNEDLQDALSNPEKYDVEQRNAKGELELLEKVALPPIVKMTEELAALGAPSGEEEKVEAVIAAFEEEIEKIEANPQSVVSGTGGEFTEANKLAREIGLRACNSI